MAYGWMGNGFLLKSKVSGEESSDFLGFVKESIGNTSVQNLALGLMENGELSEEYYYFIDKPVDNTTLFKMASVTKWVTAWGVLNLV